jgi:hypothetical protein
MSSGLVTNLKKNQALRVIYRELYYLSRKISVSLFTYLIKITKFKALTRNCLIQEGSKYNLTEFGIDELLELGNFYTLKPIPERIEQKIYPMSVKVVKPFVCEINNARIIGSNPVAFTQDNSLILETTLPRFSEVESHIAKNVSSKTLLLSKLPFKAQSNPIEIAAILTNPWSGNFWHWTVDVLTQLEGIDYYYQRTGIKPKLIVDRTMRTWQKDSLRLLGYGEDDWIVWQNRSTLVEKLIVSSFRRAYEEIYGEISAAACLWLRDRILSNLPQSKNNLAFSPHIFISRRKALGRRIFNEDEVINALTPLGFSVYLLEEMSYAEQVQLFSQAKVIIAPHGAGLTNLIFADNPIIIELFGAYVGREFANLSRSLGFKYGCLGCASPRGEMRQHDGDMIVDVNQLLKLLEIC